MSFAADTAANRQRIVFASGNVGKAREIEAMLGEDFAVVLQGDLGIDPVEETGATFAANSRLKAEHAARLSGLPALADDSGIEVDALDGAPGVISARYAGAGSSDADNLQKLLHELRDVPAEKRSARFRCVLTYMRSADDLAPLVAEGRWEGNIAFAPSGDGGFGYDPVFVDADSGIVSAAMPAAEKNARSHRGKALQELRRLLADAS